MGTTVEFQPSGQCYLLLDGRLVTRCVFFVDRVELMSAFVFYVPKTWDCMDWTSDVMSSPADLDRKKWSCFVPIGSDSCDGLRIGLLPSGYVSSFEGDQRRIEGIALDAAPLTIDQIEELFKETPK